MIHTLRFLIFLLLDLVFASISQQLLQRRGLRMKRLLKQKVDLETRMANYEIGNRVIIDSSRLDPQALLFQLKPDLLLEHAKICSRVSKIGQASVPRIGLHEQVQLLDQVYTNEFEFLRGNNQVSGYLLSTRSRGKTSFIASFAGTSTKLDIAHISLSAETFLHDVPTHGGISFLVYHNTNDLHQFIEQERKSNHEVDLVLTGHSLGGVISLLAIFDLKKRWEGEQHVRISCLNLAGPSPFKVAHAESVLETIGYNNLLNIYRRADPIYQAANVVGMIGIGPSIYLQDKFLENPKKLPIVTRVKENFRNNHFVGGYINDLQDPANNDLWSYLAVLEELVEINKKIKFYDYFNE